jgi:hypothetical protein
METDPDVVKEELRTELLMSMQKFEATGICWCC